MKQILLLIVLCLIAVSLAAVDPVALVIKTQGEIKISRNHQQSSATAGSALYSGDQIISGDKAFAAVRYVDGNALLKVLPNSQVTIKGSREGSVLKKSPSIEKGSLLSQIKKRTNYSLETPSAVASVKGTGYLTGVDDNGNTTVWVFDGVVVLVNPTSHSTVELQPGQMATLDADGNWVVSSFTSSDVDPALWAMIRDDINQGELDIILQDPQGARKTLKINLK